MTTLLEHLVNIHFGDRLLERRQRVRKALEALGPLLLIHNSDLTSAAQLRAVHPHLEPTTLTVQRHRQTHRCLRRQTHKPVAHNVRQLDSQLLDAPDRHARRQRLPRKVNKRADGQNTLPIDAVTKQVAVRGPTHVDAVLFAHTRAWIQAIRGARDGWLLFKKKNSITKNITNYFYTK